MLLSFQNLFYSFAIRKPFHLLSANHAPTKNHTRVLNARPFFALVIMTNKRAPGQSCAHPRPSSTRPLPPLPLKCHARTTTFPAHAITASNGDFLSE